MMTIEITLPLDIENLLRQEAVQHQIPLAEHAQRLLLKVLQQHIQTVEHAVPGPGEAERRSEKFYATATAQEWNEELRNWSESHRNLPLLPDEAFERESFYGDNS